MIFHDISVLQDQVIRQITKQENDSLIFYMASGTRYRMAHMQDCCEDVFLDDVCGDLNDLIGSRIISAEEVTSSNQPMAMEFGEPISLAVDSDNEHDDYDDMSYTWTFYKISSEKGSVTLRWYGQSNGYYSESVEFFDITNGDDDY